MPCLTTGRYFSLLLELPQLMNKKRMDWQFVFFGGLQLPS
jgi:hypothetical protein